MRMMRRWLMTLALLACPALLHAQEIREPAFTESALTGLETLWVRGDFLLWWTKSARVAPLVTTGTPPNTGILGVDGTTILSPGAIDYGVTPGYGGEFGYWLDPDNTWGLVASAKFLVDRDSQSVWASDTTGTPVLSNPILSNVIDPAVFAEDVILNSFPALANGRISLVTDMQFWTASGDVYLNISSDRTINTCLLVGYRYTSLKDRLGLNSVNTSQINLDVTNRTDGFDTTNDFQAADFGLRFGVNQGMFTLDLLGKIAVGNNSQRLQINGNTVTQSGIDGSITNAVGGIYTQAGNIGTYRRDVFTFSPEIAARLGMNFGPYVSTFIGYDLIYIDDVMRASEQIDRRINALNAGISPPLTITNSSFWAQGVTFSVEFHF